jgi:hypothetical protein
MEEFAYPLIGNNNIIKYVLDYSDCHNKTQQALCLIPCKINFPQFWKSRINVSGEGFLT